MRPQRQETRGASVDPRRAAGRASRIHGAGWGGNGTAAGRQPEPDGEASLARRIGPFQGPADQCAHRGVDVPAADAGQRQRETTTYGPVVQFRTLESDERMRTDDGTVVDWWVMLGGLRFLRSAVPTPVDASDVSR